MGFLDEYKSLDERQSSEQQTQPLYVSLTGRPNRDTIISQDDILNLTITLNTTRDVKHFLLEVSHE